MKKFEPLAAVSRLWNSSSESWDDGWVAAHKQVTVGISRQAIGLMVIFLGKMLVGITKP